MFPELFSVGSFTVYSYGLMTALGIFSAVLLGEYYLKKTKIAEEGFLIGMGIACVIGGYPVRWIRLFQIVILDYDIAGINRKSRQNA